MATFVDLGNMRAKLDTRTGQIRITSSEKDSPLKEKGFVLNVSRGSREYAALIELLESANKSAPAESKDFFTGESLQNILNQVDSVENNYQRGYVLSGIVKWETIGSQEQSLLVRTIQSLLFADEYLRGLYYNGSLTMNEGQGWLERLVESTRNHGAAMSRIDHVRASLDDDDEWGEKLAEFVEDTTQDNINQEKEEGSRAHNRFIKLAHKVALYANGGWEEGTAHQLPKIVHMSEKHHSFLPGEIPLGVDKDGATFKWEAEKYGSLAVSGGAGSGKSMLLSSVIHHINQNKRTTKAYVSSMKWTKELNHDLYLDGLSLLDENIDINNNPLEYARKVHSMMMDRYEYMEKNHLNSLSQEIARGEMKRAFLIVDGIEEWLHLSAYSKPEGQSQETRLILGSLLRRGRGAGVHVVLSSQRDPSFWDLGNESLANVSMRAGLKSRGEIDLTASNKKHEVKGFSLK